MSSVVSKHAVIGMGAILAMATQPLLANHCGQKKSEEQGRSTSYFESRPFRYPSTYGYIPARGYTTYGYIAPETSWWEAGAEPGMAQSQMVRFSGTVDSVKVFTIPSLNRPQVVAIVDTGNLNRYRVVLGSIDQLTPADVVPGQRISLAGRPETLAGVNCIFATGFTTPDGTWMSTHRRGGPIYGFVPAQPPQQQWYTGKIRSHETETVNGVKHMIVSVKLDNGDKISADLGPVTGFDLDNGQNIAILGNWGERDGKDTLIANQFKWQGGDYTIMSAPQAGPLHLSIGVE